MPWFNLDSKLHSHPKPRRAGLEAMGLWAVSGAYCSDVLSDGFVPDWYIETWPKGHRLAQKLIDSGLWDKAAGGYKMSDRSLWRVVRLRPGKGRQSARPWIRAAVLKRDGNKCVACGSIDDLTIDHIWPWSRGGTDDLDNLQALCRSCNSKKGNRVA